MSKQRDLVLKSCIKSLFFDDFLKLAKILSRGRTNNF